jgi:hypothetical protein
MRAAWQYPIMWRPASYRQAGSGDNGVRLDQPKCVAIHDPNDYTTSHACPRLLLHILNADNSAESLRILFNLVYSTRIMANLELKVHSCSETKEIKDINNF